MDFTGFVLAHLPPPPARVLEVGCGSAGGVVPALAALGYEVLGVDPDAPEGEWYVRGRFQELEPAEWDAVVAGRVLHHVWPLAEGLDRLAAFAPLLLVDEFASDRIGEAAQDWYEAQHRLLVAAGAEPPGPPSLGAWRGRHPDLHPHRLVLDGLRERYEERTLEWRPALYRWLGGPASEELEAGLVAAAAIPAIGWRFAGLRRSSPGAR